MFYDHAKNQQKNGRIVMRPYEKNGKVFVGAIHESPAKVSLRLIYERPTTEDLLYGIII